MGRLRNTLAAAAVGAALAAPSASASSSPPSAFAPVPAGAPQQPASSAAAPAPEAPGLQQGDAIVAPAVPEAPAEPQQSGGTGADKPSKPQQPTADGTAAEPDGGTVPAPSPSEAFAIPAIPTSTCAPAGVPPVLIPVYQRAADAYGLGPQGAAILASINGIESAFGTNMGPSSAGAVGWMQFLPSTWETYGVDANGDGVRDPYNPEDAIYAAARYLSAAGMPTDTYGAIYAYNHADWYVAEVLANASCYGALGGGAGGAFSLSPQLQTLACRPAPAWRKRIPRHYLAAFEDAAARYELGERGVWALAGVARLESSFGRGMGERDLRESGPLGLDGSEWAAYAVDGDGDGRIRRADPDDSAATLARMIWSRGSLRAGLFTHNQAQWYVQAVLDEADQLEGACRVTPADWAILLPEAAVAPIDWDNLTLSNDLEVRDLTTGGLDPRIVGLIGMITQDHQLTISALRSDHSEYTASGYVSNHFYGRAMDIAAVDGVSCTDTAVDAACANLGRSLAYLPAPAHPTELIYCFDLDGPGPAFALPDHCDHIHAGYDG
jgi:soluble lytic murein transglycosylase-like protein